MTTARFCDVKVMDNRLPSYIIRNDIEFTHWIQRCPEQMMNMHSQTNVWKQDDIMEYHELDASQKNIKMLIQGDTKRPSISPCQPQNIPILK